MHVNIFAARTWLSQLVKLVQAGEEIVIANRGRPVARLVAASPAANPAGQGAARALRPEATDALHLAAAQFHRCRGLWTNDDRLAQAAHGLAVNVSA